MTPALGVAPQNVAELSEFKCWLRSFFFRQPLAVACALSSLGITGEKHAMWTLTGAVWEREQNSTLETFAYLLVT